MPATKNYGSIPTPDRRAVTYSIDASELEGQAFSRTNVQHSTRRMLVTVLLTGTLVLLAAGYLASSSASSLLSSTSNHAADAPSDQLPASAPGGSAPPVQVHVALADLERLTSSTSQQRLGITVSWATSAQTRTSSVRFGSRPSNLTTTVLAPTLSKQYQFCEYTSPWFHHVVVPASQLEPSSTYYCTLLALSLRLLLLLDETNLALCHA